MSCHQSVTIGPFRQYTSPSKRVDHYALLPDERLHKAFPMGASSTPGDVYLANIPAPGCVSVHIGSDTPDAAFAVPDLQAEQAEAFRAAFAREIEVLDAAYGMKGVVRFGVVVSWG